MDDVVISSHYVKHNYLYHEYFYHFFLLGLDSYVLILFAILDSSYKQERGFVTIC